MTSPWAEAARLSVIAPRYNFPDNALMRDGRASKELLERDREQPTVQPTPTPSSRHGAMLHVVVTIFILFVAAAVGAEPIVETKGLPYLDFRQVIKDSKDKVFPTVVFIKCVRENLEGGKKVSQEISGSGVLISARGEVLSNWHVVDKATEVRCLLFDGQAFEAKVMGADKDTDLSLLQLKLPPDAKPLPFASIGDSSQLKEGDFVMAMGAPWGLSRSVSIGIVSCTRRFLPQSSEYSLWLQTDAAISPGNSGGPLVNTAGEVIGINTRGMMQGGDTGFAIPTDVINHIVKQIRTSGRVNWSWTGLQLQPLRDFGKNIYFDFTEGVIIAETDPESPARRAGIQAGDRLLRINGQTVTALTEEELPAIRRQLGSLPKMETARLELVRKGKNFTTEVTPREKGKVEGEELDLPRWDLTLKSINQFDNPDLFFNRQKGVFIYGIKYPGNAQTAGLQVKDILLKIDDKEISDLKEVEAYHKQALENVSNKYRMVLSVLRNGLIRQTVLDFSRNHEKE
jgi:serine protease Do